MPSYNQELKEAIVAKVLKDPNINITKLSEESGIAKGTIYTWIKKYKSLNNSENIKRKTKDQFSSSEKFRMVLETASMNESDTSKYCRNKGIFPEDLKEWKEICVNANGNSIKEAVRLNSELKKEIQEKKKLEKELSRKEKALAETAALLVLRKKINAIWEKDEED